MIKMKKPAGLKDKGVNHGHDVGKLTWQKGERDDLLKAGGRDKNARVARLAEI
jgi:hypothetical protein